MAPTGFMLRQVAENFFEQGHEVKILCAKGDYAETAVKRGLDPDIKKLFLISWKKNEIQLVCLVVCRRRA